MMGPRQLDQAALFYEFSLERHVPATHLQRAIEPHIPVFDKSARDDGGDFDYNQEADIYVCDLHRHSRERWG